MPSLQILEIHVGKSRMNTEQEQLLSFSQVSLFKFSLFQGLYFHFRKHFNINILMDNLFPENALCEVQRLSTAIR